MQKISSLCQKINKVNPSFFAFVRFYRISLSRFGQLHQENGRCFRHSGRRAQAAAHTPPSAPTQHSASAANSSGSRAGSAAAPTARTAAWGSSQHRHRQSAARPAAHRVRPFSGFGRYSARARLLSSNSAASACHTAAVGATRCQLELFSIKRISTFQ